jgi:hypothetical protein
MNAQFPLQSTPFAGQCPAVVEATRGPRQKTIARLGPANHGEVARRETRNTQPSAWRLACAQAETI